MQTWAKRGIQSALVTGGLLMLGTGIASAQENVSPDTPPSPLDSKVRVPIEVDKNNLGTPVGNHDLPSIRQELGTESLRATVPANPLFRGLQDRAGGVDTSHVTRGNTVDGDVVVPVMACGNAVAAGGDAQSVESCDQSARTTDTGRVLRTDGSNSALAGNAVAAHSATPVLVSGNAVAAGADAYSETAARQDAAAGGDVETAGSDGALAGNVVAAQQATPVQLANNGVAAAGVANSTSTADSTARSGGALNANGDRSSVGGNVVGVPLAPAAAVDGNAVSGVGNADALSRTSTGSTAGRERVAPNGATRYANTSGEDATAAGGVVQPQFAGPIATNGNAVAGLGNADTVNTTKGVAKAGGVTDTSGDDSTVSGTIADAPIALPSTTGGNAVTAVGNGSAAHRNQTAADAGGETLTNGDRSVLSGNSANTPPAGAFDLCGNGVSGGGIADGECDNVVESEAGGYNGTTGNDSVLSGNIGQAPLGVPAEGFGNGAAAAGTASGAAAEDKVIRSGGTPNSRDDDGTVSSNVVTAPTAVGGQVFGDAAGVVANPTSRSDSDTTIVTGGPAQATGQHGSASGNIVEAPTSNPAQAFGLTAVGVGNGSSDVSNRLRSRSGGSAASTGDEGSVAGNVVSLPEATSPQVFGSAVGVGGNTESRAGNDFTSFSGGDVATSGNRGSLAGNGVTAQPAVPFQAFSDTVSAVGNGRSDVDNNSAVVAGGGHSTEAWDSSVSGNLVSAPVNAGPGAFGDALAAVGRAESETDNTTLSQSGGATATKGRGSVAAQELALPNEARPIVHDVPGEVLGTATTATRDDSRQRTGDDDVDGNPVRDSADQGIHLPLGIDSLMGPTEVPSLSSLDRLASFGSLDLLSDLHAPRELALDGARLLTVPPVLVDEDRPLTTPVLAVPPHRPTEMTPPRLGAPVIAAESGEARAETVRVSQVREVREHARLPRSARKAPGLNQLTGGLSVAGLGEGSPLSGLAGGLTPARLVEGLTRAASTVGGATRHADAEERSFTGTLPLVDQDAPTLPTLPAVQRELPGLPVASPAPLPFVVPVPGVAQPRTQAAPALPALDGLADAEVTRPLAPITQRVHAPALAGLDARTVFGALEDTTVLPRI